MSSTKPPLHTPPDPPLSPLCWIPDPFSSSYPRLHGASHQCTRCGSSSVDTLTVSCPLGCGAAYCSTSCQESAMIPPGRHGRICVGPVDESHPLYRYKVLALECGRCIWPELYSVLMLGLEVAVCHPPNVFQELVGQRIGTSGQNFEERLRDTGDIHIGNELKDAFIVKASHNLVVEILTKLEIEAEKEDKKVLSLEDWDALLAYVNLNRISVEVPSARADWCRRTTESGGWHEDHILLQEAKSEFEVENGLDDGRGLVDDTNVSEESEDEDASSSGSRTSGSAEPTITVDAVHLMDEPDFYFPPHVSFFLPSRALRHSCMPTHCVRFVPRGSGGDNSSEYSIENLQIELCPIEESRGGLRSERTDDESTILGPELSLSLIDNTENVEGRARQLALRGINECNCVRCAFERDCLEHPSHQQTRVVHRDGVRFSEPALLRLLSLAKFDQRYDDGLQVCETMLSMDPSDPTALVGRARIAGWMGDYCGREALLKEAAMATDDDEVHSLLHEANAYYRSDSWGCRSDLATTANDRRCRYEEIAGLNGRSFVAERALDAGEVAAMVSCVEEHQSTSPGGWTTSRHYSVPTTDVPVYKIPKLLTWFNKQLEQCIFPMLENQFSIKSERQRLRIFDAFFVKYDADAGRKRLPLHNDQSIYSVTIAMNPAECYSGGGTYFAATGEAIRTDVGGIVSFEGDLIHAGMNINNGKRYIITCFIYVEDKG